MKKKLSKAEFKEAYMKYRTEGDGWSDNYWDHFYKNQEGGSYWITEPETPQHTRMFISGGPGSVHLFFMTDESEERLFDYPGKE